ncbi:MAG: TOBE domain-containing protein [Cyclobacteriaceae bacterium]|nr:TOBE domain-containing protein [Cyclobacteriaceae bacterium]
MNQLEGTIDRIDSKGNLSVVDIQVGGSILTTIVIETPETVSYLRKDLSINVLFKETEVMLAIEKPGRWSVTNQLACTVEKIENGELLSKISLSYEGHPLQCLLLTRVVRDMGLMSGQAVWAMVETTEIMLQA